VSPVASGSDAERYVVSRPAAAGGCLGVQGCDATRRTFLSDAQVPGCNHYLDMTWVYADSQPGRYASARVLDHDQYLLHLGMDWTAPQNLGATVRFHLGGRPITFDTMTAVYIPAGVAYGPLAWTEFRRPHIQLCLVMGSGVAPTGRPVEPAGAGPGAAGGAGSGAAIPWAAQDIGVDYERYVIRSPMREAGPDHVDGRQNPTMTYLSRTQVPGVDAYNEFGWIWNVPEPPIPKMRHDHFDEIVVHIGSDPDHPEDLGGVLQMGVGAETVELNTTHCAYLPRGVDHGPLVWTEVRRPLIEMAIMLGAGTLAEGWANSFFDLPDGGRRGPK
jgi:hypothetical protein